MVAEVLLDGGQYGVVHFRCIEQTILTDGVGDASLQSFCVVIVSNAHILLLVDEGKYVFRN
jgi:hypothetical protein